MRLQIQGNFGPDQHDQHAHGAAQPLNQGGSNNDRYVQDDDTSVRPLHQLTRICPSILARRDEVTEVREQVARDDA